MNSKQTPRRIPMQKKEDPHALDNGDFWGLHRRAPNSFSLRKAHIT